jgi:hypothetical protein
MKLLHMLKFAFFGAIGEDQFARRLALHKYKRDQFRKLYVKMHKNYHALLQLSHKAPTKTHYEMAKKARQDALFQSHSLLADYQEEARAYCATLFAFILINLPFNLVSAYCITTIIKVFL